MSLLAPLRHALRRKAVRGRVPEQLRRRYARLYEGTVEPTPDGGARFDQARLWRQGGVNILHLAGDRFEMAFQHGRLLQAEIARGTIHQASLIVRHAIRASLGDGLLASVGSWYADACIAEPILRSGLAYPSGSSSEGLAEVYGLSEGSSVPGPTVVRGAVGPETAQTLLGLTESGGVAPSCTSFAAWGSATRDGEMIIGRNTDYPLNGYYDAAPTVVYFEPTDGAHRHMTITSAGFHTAGVCGLNEHGISIGVHTVLARSVSETGIPVFLLGQEILRRATTLDEAASLVSATRPAAGWNYHVVSVRERQAVTFELCNVATASRRAEGESHITTNHWTQPEMVPHQLIENATFTGDSLAREERVRRLVDAAGGTLDAVAAAEILGDSIDPKSGRARCFPNTVAATHTVSTSVWQPDAHAVHVGVATAPTSQGSFVTLPTPDAFDAESMAESVGTFRVSPEGADAPGLAEARQLVIAARLVFEYDGDAVAAADQMKAAAARYEDPSLGLAWALMEVRAGRFSLAEKAVERCLDQNWDPLSAVVARYLRGRLVAERGDAKAARADLRAVQDDESACDRLADAARAAEARLRRRSRLRLHPIEIVPMGWLPDTFRYFGRL